MSAFDNAQGQETRAREYTQKKEKLSRQFLELLQSKTGGIALQKTSSNLFRNRKESHPKIDVRNFNQVIAIDRENQIAEIEGMASYEHIVAETLKYGFLPAVVPELKSITIGGALAGVGIEASSFRYGLVHETILEYEVLLGNGQIILCRPDNEYRDLYYAFPNTYGTLGYALKVKVKLIPAKKYLKLSHIAFRDSVQYFEYIRKICNENKKPNMNTDRDIAYIEGVIFHKNEQYVTLGEFSDSAPWESNYRYRNTYYQSIRRKKMDYLKTVDYIWRWDTDWFWCSKHFGMQNPLLRLVFGKFLLGSKVFWKIKKFFNTHKIAKYFADRLTGRIESVIQDIDVPIERAQEFLDFFETEIGIKPIWICPIKPYRPNVQYNFYKLDPNVLYINFGFWDLVPSDKPDGFYNRKIEQKVQDLGGMKSLYSNVYYTPEEFWGIYNQDYYRGLKEKYDPQGNLRGLYQKCTEKS